ncbi:MAG: polysaccharide deacetylase family protein [Aureispira sp.]
MKPFPIFLRAKALGTGLLLGLLLLYVLACPWWSYALVLGMAFGIAYWGTTQITSHFYLPTHCYGNSPHRKQMALTFDDGILEPEQTQQILAILERYNIPATFFCIGKNIQHPIQQKLLLHIHESGHLIGNHSFSHAHLFDFYSKSRIVEEIQQTDALIGDLIGQQPLFFRPPYGITTPNIANALKQLPHQTIGWSVRSLDTVIKNEKQLLGRLKKQLHPGAIILLHDHIKTLPTVLPLFLDYVLKEGYTIVGLDQLLQLPAYQH